MQNHINEEERKDVMVILSAELEKRVNQKGDLSFNSPHECRGVLEEEVAEHLDELRANNLKGQVDELFDIAIAAIWGIASIIKNSEK